MPEPRMTLAGRVLQYLQDNGGSVTSETGRGLTAQMAAAVGTNQGVLNGVLTRMETAGTVTRQVRGRRTFAISAAAPAATGSPRRRRAKADEGGAAAPARSKGRARATATASGAVDGRGPSSDLDRVFTELAALREALAAQREAGAELARRLEALETADGDRAGGNGDTGRPAEAGMRMFRRRRG